MNLSTIIARDLPEAWYLCIKECMDNGFTHHIDRGSHQGVERRELDSITLLVKEPGHKPLVPDVPEGVPPPTSMEYVEKYLPYLMCGVKEKNELYTYGEDLDAQITELVKIYRQTKEESGGYGTNQACMSVGSWKSIFLEHSQCLRVVDTRIKDNRLHMYVYFRSWDLWAGFPSNLAAIQLMKEYIVSELGIEDGELVAYSKGLHIYSHDWKVANMLLRRAM